MKSHFFTVIFFCSVFALALGKPALAEQRTVLIVYSYDKELAWTQQCDRGIMETLPSNVLIERLYMDTKRIPKEQFESRAKEVLGEFVRIKPDLVLISDDNALQLVGPEIAATGVPLVYLGINGNPRNYFDDLPMNVAGVIERIPLFHWIRILFEIMPSADSLLVLVDDSPTASAIIRSSFLGRKSVNIGRTIVWEKAGDWAQWQQIVLGKESGIILMPSYHNLKDDNGIHIPYDTVVLWTSQNSHVPVFATQDYAVGIEKLVGAFVVLGEEHGRIAGRMARDVLEGKSLLELSTASDQQGVFYFNLEQLNRFGVILPEKIRKKAIFRK